MDSARRTRIWRAVLAGIFIAAWAPILFAQSRESTIPSLPENDNPSTAIHIALTTAQQPLKAGDAITLTAKADKDCHLTVLHLGVSGKVTLLWPNVGSQWDDRVTAGRPIDVPGPNADFKIIVDGKSPFERIAAYATTDKDLIFRQTDFRVMPEVKVKIFEGTVAELVRAFRSRVARLPREQRWGTAESALRVASTTHGNADDNDPCQRTVELREVSSKSVSRKAFVARDFGEKSLEAMEHALISEPSNGRLGSGRIESVSGFKQYEPRDMVLKSEHLDLDVLDIKDPDIPKTVCGKDERVQQSPCTDVPWRWNCSLVITWPNGDRSIGTGWLIGPRTVMTAGHCVYNHEQKAWATQIEVSPGTDGEIAAVRLAKIKGPAKRRQVGQRSGQ